MSMSIVTIGTTVPLMCAPENGDAIVSGLQEAMGQLRIQGEKAGRGIIHWNDAQLHLEGMDKGLTVRGLSLSCEQE